MYVHSQWRQVSIMPWRGRQGRRDAQSIKLKCVDDGNGDDESRGWMDGRTELELDATGVFIYLPILLDEHGHIQKSLV